MPAKTAATPAPGLSLLFADDELNLQELMRLELPRMGHRATICPDGATAVAAIEQSQYDCVIVDLDMPGFSGIDVIARLKEVSPETDAVVLTGKSTLESAIAALRHGAFDYLTKPCKLVQIEALLKRVADRRELAKKHFALQRRLESLEGAPTLIGDTRSMDQLKRLIAKVAPTESTVLIRGETGSGKELVARAVHDQSPRASAPFVAVNCGALADSLIESELFGHAKGAFTGADEHRAGLFEVAGGGTIFLDEIGELPKAMQAKLLRVLESREVRRVGENQPTKIDVRIVCATHRDVEKMVSDGDFREDLMYRINTFEVHVPPLRERLDDIPRLAEHLLRRFRPSARPIEQQLTDAAVEALRGHVWPGNVRELANVIEHATILCDSGPIDAACLPRRFDRRQLSAAARSRGPATLKQLEMEAIHDALERHDGSKPRAAEELGVSLKTLYNKLNADANLREAG